MKPVSKLRNIDYSLPMQLLQATKSATALFRTMLHSHELTDQQWRIIRVLANQNNMMIKDEKKEDYDELKMNIFLRCNNSDIKGAIRG